MRATRAVIIILYLINRTYLLDFLSEYYISKNSNARGNLIRGEEILLMYPTEQ